MAYVGGNQPWPLLFVSWGLPSFPWTYIATEEMFFCRMGSVCLNRIKNNLIHRNLGL